jgi:hypothetical protein
VHDGGKILALRTKEQRNHKHILEGKRVQTLWSRVLFKKLIIGQLVKKFPTYHGVRLSMSETWFTALGGENRLRLFGSSSSSSSSSSS